MKRASHNVDWDACANVVGGAERASMESLLEMEAMNTTGEKNAHLSDAAVTFVGGFRQSL